MQLSEQNKEKLLRELLKLKLKEVKSIEDKARIQHIQQILDTLI